MNAASGRLIDDERRLGEPLPDVRHLAVELAGRLRPVLYAEPLERFERTRALLDLIGWKDETDERPAIVNLVGHRQALLGALQAQVETEREMVRDDPTLKGAEQQIACARRRVADIEQFLALAGATLAERE